MQRQNDSNYKTELERIQNEMKMNFVQMLLLQLLVKLLRLLPHLTKLLSKHK